MKILASLKSIKHLDRKIEKNKERISKWCSYIVEVREGEAAGEPVYNRSDLIKMVQQIRDWTAEKVRIRHALHITNMETKAEFDGKSYTIDELLLIQNVVIPTQIATLKLMRRVEKGRSYMSSSSDPNVKSWVELQYDPKERDQLVESHERDLEKLDEILDTLNIETDVIGL